MKELDFSQYNTAIIIGNGFDINLGLPTGYENFIESAQFETLINNGNQLAVHLKNNYNLKNWIDIEKELSLYSMEGATESYKKEYDDLSASLTDYINDIDYLKMKKHGAAYDLMHQIAKGKSFIILDFNYTKSIRLLLSNFGLSDERIELCHLKVHGEAEKRNIVFGVEDKAPIKPEHVFIRKAYNKSFKALNFTELYKNVSSVMFFGHSLGESDHTYFKATKEAAVTCPRKDKGSAVGYISLKPTVVAVVLSRSAEGVVHPFPHRAERQRHEGHPFLIRDRYKGGCVLLCNKVRHTHFFFFLIDCF